MAEATGKLSATGRREQRAEVQWRRLTDVVDEAARVLRGGPGDPAAAQALELLEQARWGN